MRVCDICKCHDAMYKHIKTNKDYCSSCHDHYAWDKVRDEFEDVG